MRLVASDEEVVEPVAVNVAEDAAEAVAAGKVDARILGDVGERTVAIVLEKKTFSFTVVEFTSNHVRVNFCWGS